MKRVTITKGNYFSSNKQTYNKQVFQHLDFLTLYIEFQICFMRSFKDIIFPHYSNLLTHFCNYVAYNSFLSWEA